jgi:hypothetical protein
MFLDQVDLYSPGLVIPCDLLKYSCLTKVAHVPFNCPNITEMNLSGGEYLTFQFKFLPYK